LTGPPVSIFGLSVAAAGAVVSCPFRIMSGLRWAGLLICAVFALSLSKADGQDAQTPATELDQERLQFSGHDARGAFQNHISSMH